MFLAISFLAALAGVGLAAAAALLPETGVNGTGGAFLALIGAAAVSVGAGILLAARRSPGWRGLLLTVTALVAILTALAGWFLMQDALVAIMAVSLLALLADAAMPSQRTAR